VIKPDHAFQGKDSMRKVFLAAFASMALFASAALAAEPIPFTAASFAAAQQADKPILVHIHADWCPICARQRQILGRLEAMPAFENLVVFNVDFDGQKDVVREFGARRQGTLIVFRDGAEKGRAVSETDPVKIKALLEKAEIQKHAGLR
jgi:thioredoxin